MASVPRQCLVIYLPLIIIIFVIMKHLSYHFEVAFDHSELLIASENYLSTSFEVN